jgi:hypothetical protein
MARRCEVCNPGNPQSGAKLSRFLVEDRVLSLCAEHGAKFREHRPETREAAGALFPESGGRRSLLDRRAPLDRRHFPARPEGRRRGSGRREGDSAGE